MSNTAYLGLDIGGTKIFGARFEADHIVQQKKVSTESEQGKAQVLKNITAVISELLSPAVSAIGIAWAGFIDTGGIIQKSPNISGFERFDLAEYLQQQFALPVFIENDARLFAFAESHAQKAPNLLGIILGTGVGSGLILDGKMYRGAEGFAGEIGHCTFQGNNTQKVEDIFSGPALDSLFRKQGLEKSLEYYASEWQQQKGIAFDIFENWLRDLALWVSNLALTLNPEKIVFGGGIGTDILPLLESSLSQKAQHLLQEKGLPLHVFLATSKLPNAGALGAALFAETRYKNS